MLSFLDSVYDWNDYAGLTRVGRADALRLHLLDSLSIAVELEDMTTILDLGTGAGFPGFPLALAFPNKVFTLVESRSRRCSFLREEARRIGVGQRVNVMHVDAHKLKGALLVDAVVSRAFLPPHELLELGLTLVRPGGRVVVMLGDAPRNEAPVFDPQRVGPGAVSISDRRFRLPLIGEGRRIAVFERGLG
jgi:16S rRNA (guanine527-N7)-methyltransferase